MDEKPKRGPVLRQLYLKAEDDDMLIAINEAFGGDLDMSKIMRRAIRNLHKQVVVDKTYTVDGQ